MLQYWSTAPLHSRSVRGDELKCRSSTPTFRLDYKLATHPLEESITLKLWLEHLGLELPPASTLSDNLNAVSNQTRALIHQVQLRSILEQGLDDFSEELHRQHRSGSQYRAAH